MLFPVLTALRGAALAVVLLFPFYPVAGSPLPPDPPLEALYAAAGTGRETAVALSGDRALIGAPEKNGGQVFVYEYDRAASEWALRDVLDAPSGSADFGRSVALAGNRVVVGAPGRAGGSVYIFVPKPSGQGWRLEDRLRVPGRAGRRFGWAVAASGLQVLASEYDGTKGAAHVFSYRGGQWQQDAILRSPFRSGRDHFGASVALSEGRALVGALGADGFAGAAYLFTAESNGSQWSDGVPLLPPDETPFAYYGVSVALSGGRALVGAIGLDEMAGAAYSFAHDERADAWRYEHTLRPPDAQPLAQYGVSVALSGGRALVGAYGVREEGASGAAFAYTRSGTRWVYETTLQASPTTRGKGFGWTVALSGERVFVGARGGAESPAPTVTAPVSCTDARLSFASFAVSGSGGEHLHLRNESAVPVRLEPCSMAVLDIPSGRFTYSTAYERAEALPVADLHRMANPGSGPAEQRFPQHSLPDGPGALVVWPGPPLPPGTRLSDLEGAEVVAAVIYDDEGEVIAHYPEARTTRSSQAGPAGGGDFFAVAMRMYERLSGRSAPGEAPLPEALTLSDVWPNPSRGPVSLRFGVPADGPVRVTLYDALGREAAVLLDEPRTAGWHTVRLERPLASGTYIARVVASGAAQARRLVIVR